MSARLPANFADAHEVWTVLVSLPSAAARFTTATATLTASSTAAAPAFNKRHTKTAA